MAESSQKGGKTTWEISPFPSVFKNFQLKTYKNKGLFGKGYRNKTWNKRGRGKTLIPEINTKSSTKTYKATAWVGIATEAYFSFHIQ